MDLFQRHRSSSRISNLILFLSICIVSVLIYFYTKSILQSHRQTNTTRTRLLRRPEIASECLENDEYVQELEPDEFQNYKYLERQRSYFVTVDSDVYDVSTGTISVPINLRQVLSVELFSASIPKTEYVINQYNDRFNVTVNSSTSTVILSHGDYDSNTLGDHLQEKLRLISNLSTITVTFSTVTSKYTFTQSSTTYSFDFTGYELLAYNLGLSNTESTTNGVITAANKCDLSNGRYLLIKCKQLEKEYINTDVIGTVPLYEKLNIVQGIRGTSIREFLQPLERVKTLELILKSKFPRITPKPYNSHGLSFQFVLLIKTFNRSFDYKKKTDLLF